MQQLDIITVPEEYHLERIDKFLSSLPEIDLSRSLIQKLINSSNILVNEKEIKQRYKVKTDDEISITIPEPEPLEVEPQDIPINIVYEDKDIAIINKQPGLVVHPGPGNWDKTLVNALLFHLNDLSSIGGVIRPGIVHRLDKDTTGLMIVAKNDNSHSFFVDAFANRAINKKYTAVVIGKPKEAHFIIEEPLARHKKYRHKMTVTETGKESKTEGLITEVYNTQLGTFSLLDIKLHTGRTHQIRVHLSSSGTPIVGDPVYSKKPEKHKVSYLLLAATSIEFEHPTSKKIMSFSIDIPEHITAFIHKLEKNKNI